MKRINILIVAFVLTLLLCSCENGSGFVIEKSDVPVYYEDVLSLTNTYPHDTSSYTQGLFFFGDEMYESTGQYGYSKVYKNVDIETGVQEKGCDLPSDIFGEGSVVFEEALYVLSWKENKVFKLDPDTLDMIDTLAYEREGWGLTTDGKYLIASDGTSSIYFMDKDLNDVNSITVKYGDIEIANINELEYIDGFIWANVWLTNDIFVIDPKTGEVMNIISFEGLYDETTGDPNAVLNGIAFDESEDKLYITGKLWNTMYEFELKK